MPFPSRELAVHCARLVDQKGGSEVRVLQLPATAHSFDFAVLVTATSDRLTNALVEEVWHFCKRHKVPRMPVEGESGWMLIDCYDVVVHALTEEKRAFYQLDTLWTLARDVDWAKEAKALPDPDKPVAEESAPAKKAAPRKPKAADEDEAPEAKKAAPRKRKAVDEDEAPAAKKAAPRKRKPAVRAKRARDE